MHTAHIKIVNYFLYIAATVFSNSCISVAIPLSKKIPVCKTDRIALPTSYTKHDLGQTKILLLC